MYIPEPKALWSSDFRCIYDKPLIIRNYYMCIYIIYIIVDQKPESHELERFLTEYCQSWRAIGLQLGLKSTVLNAVEGDCNKNRERFRVTLENWLLLGEATTYGDLELAITNVNRMNLSLDPLTSGE